MKHTRYRIDDDHGHFAHRPRTTYSQLMPFGDQCLLHFLADTRLDAEVTRIHRVREWRCGETARRPAWGFDRLLDVHVEVYDVEKRLNRAHELIVSSGTSHQSVGLAILHDERGCQCAAWPLAWGQGVRFPRNQGVVIAPAIEDKSQVGHHDAGSPTAVKAGHETDHVAITVDDGDIARIAVVAGVAVEVDHRILEQRCSRSLHEFFRVPGTQF